MKLNQVTVPSLDVTKSIGFYQSLGLSLIVHTHDKYARFECENGASFSIIEVEELPQGDGIHVYFECEDLDQKVDSLVANGIAFDEMPNDKPWLWREAHLKDPDGNHIILYYAGENRLNPPWKIQTQ
jgi:catechol 2,3-dioxygenase-like lactoylglutathione lyase family enzyme